MSQRGTSMQINKTAQGTYPIHKLIVEPDQRSMVYHLSMIN